VPTIRGSKGKCPACGEFKLSYFVPEVNDETVECGFECTALGCGVRGTEWYKMHYNRTTWEVSRYE